MVKYIRLTIFLIIAFVVIFCRKTDPVVEEDCGCDGAVLGDFEAERGELLVYADDSVVIVPENSSAPGTLLVCNPEAIPFEYLIDHIRVEFNGELLSACNNTLKDIYAPFNLDSIDILIIDCNDTSNTEFFYFIVEVSKKPEADKLEIYQFEYEGETYLSYEYGHPRGTGITNCSGEKICSMGGDWSYTNTCSDYFINEVTNRKLIWKNF